MKNVMNGLILQLEEQGSHSETIANYRIVCNSIIRFGSQHCADNEILFSAELLEQYLKYTEQCCQNGEISKGYARFKKRTVRMLDEYAHAGKADTSTKPIGKNIFLLTNIWI